MNKGLNAALAEATRLTREGRLRDAADLIQRNLKGAASPDPAPEYEAAEAEAPLEGEFTVLSAERPEPPPRQARPGQSRAGGRTAPAGPSPAGSWQQDLQETLRRSIPETGQGLPGMNRAGAGAPNPEVQAGGNFVAASYTGPAGSRNYRLYIPGGGREAGLPLVVMLHGCTQSPEDFAAGTRMNVLAEEQGFFVLYPEQSAAAHPTRCWNWFKDSDQQRGHGEPAILAGLTREIVRTHHLDPQRVYVAGLSAGGAMAMVLGATYPDVYAAVGVHSGLPYAVAHDLPSAYAAMQQGGNNPAAAGRPGGQSGKSLRPVPAIVFHGDRDTVVHPGNGDQVLAQWVRAHSGDTGEKLRVGHQQAQAPGGHAYSLSTYRDAGGRVVLECWRIHGAGHAWSGGSSSGSYTDPRGPDASHEMARFFLQHGRRPGRS